MAGRGAGGARRPGSRASASAAASPGLPGGGACLPGALGGAQARTRAQCACSRRPGGGARDPPAAGSAGRRCLRSVRAPTASRGAGLRREWAHSGRGPAPEGACVPLGGADRPGRGGGGGCVCEGVRSGGGLGLVSHGCPSFPPARPRAGWPPCTLWPALWCSCGAGLRDPGAAVESRAVGLALTAGTAKDLMSSGVGFLRWLSGKEQAWELGNPLPTGLSQKTKFLILLHGSHSLMSR